MTPNWPAPNLISGLAAGMPGAYAALYDQHGTALLRVARAVLGSADEAEDAVQDLFVDLLVRSRHRLAQVEDLKAYLFASLRHALKRRIARRQSQTQALRKLAFEGEHEPESPKEKEPDDQLGSALSSLPEEQREVIALKIDGDLTFAQIGKILSVSSNTAASRYRYALEKLRKTLEGHRGE